MIMMKDKFIKAVTEGDLVDVRLFLSNQLMLDPRGDSFHEMLSFAESKLNNLFEPDDGRGSKKDCSAWGKDFLFMLKNELDDNFSREKLNYYEQVAKEVLKDKARQLDEEERKHNAGPSGTHQQPNGSWYENNKKEILVGATAGSAVLTAVGLWTSKALLTSLGVVGLVAGGCLLYKEYNKKNK